MKKDEIKQFVVQLMETADAAYFTTVDSEGKPYTRAMFNLRNVKQFPKQSKLSSQQDDLLVYISTNTSSTKIEQIKANPAVSVYFSKPKIFNGAMLGGKIEIINDQEIKESLWEDGWERYYPKGVTDEDYTILRLKPEIVRIWSSSRGKHELKLS
ncbi:MAG: pyridoxamine 5'-phosphate oxidase family protein [Candidatus Hodarchaeales archaeon]|jgi:general stress protein 26